MVDTPSAEEIAAAEAYENLFVEALFAEWAPRVLDAANVRAGDRVLDVACGTGILAREALARVGSGGSVTGLDAGAGMLAVAERLEPAVHWRQGMAEELPFADDTFDVVVSQFGLMFFADRGRALREMQRVLGPGGRLAVAVWDSLERHPGYVAEVELLDRIGGRRAGDALRAPFVLGDLATLRALFDAQGMGSASIETFEGTARFPDVATMVEADLRGWLPVMGVRLSEPQIEEILEQAEEQLRPFVVDGGRVTFASPAHLVSLTAT